MKVKIKMEVDDLQYPSTPTPTLDMTLHDVPHDQAQEILNTGISTVTHHPEVVCNTRSFTAPNGKRIRVRFCAETSPLFDTF